MAPGVSLREVSCRLAISGGVCCPLPPKHGRTVPEGKPSSLLDACFAIQPRGGLKESDKLPVCISDTRWSVAAAGSNHTAQLSLLCESWGRQQPVPAFAPEPLPAPVIPVPAGEGAALALLEGEVTKLQV